MSMNVGPSSGDEDEVMSTINTTPLVDIMLVLLIIFLITIPVVTTSIPLELPKERVEIRETKPENIVLSVDQAGSIYWNDLRIPSTAALIDRLTAMGLVERRRSEQDRRVVRIGLTALGRKRREHGRLARLAMAEAMLAALDDSERERFLALMRKNTLSLFQTLLLLP
jgi:biopolymer transport protein ExbD